MYKKIVVFGGGTGISYLLKGLKDFPVEITAVISVSDNGQSTGKLREEFQTPAVGDVRKVITSLSTIDTKIKDILEYRFHTTSDLDGHALGNLILTAMLDMTGSFRKSILYLSKLLDVRHKVLPLSEEADITLMAEASDGTIICGEEAITKTTLKKKRIYYEKEPHVLKEVLQAIESADLLIFSMGSLYTSILPHILSKEVRDAISQSHAPLMYLCNIVTQPGETDGFTVGDHVAFLNQYLGTRKIDVVIANNKEIKKEMAIQYATKEQKDPVLIDYDKLKSIPVELIEADLLTIDDNTLKHHSLRLSSLIFSYLMR